MNRIQLAQQMRRALQMFAMGLADEKALEVATIYDPWENGRSYPVGEFLIYGVNGVGDPQLYKVVQPHTAQADWTPDKAKALFAVIGIDEAGYPVWSQPAGNHDAYDLGDIVNFHGVLYQSKINGNVYSPESYPEGWEAYSEAIL